MSTYPNKYFSLLDDIWSDEDEGYLSMPDLLGMMVKEAGEVLGRLGLRMEPTGLELPPCRKFLPGNSCSKGYGRESFHNLLLLHCYAISHNQVLSG